MHDVNPEAYITEKGLMMISDNKSCCRIGGNNFDRQSECHSRLPCQQGKSDES